MLEAICSKLCTAVAGAEQAIQSDQRALDSSPKRGKKPREGDDTAFAAWLRSHGHGDNHPPVTDTSPDEPKRSKLFRN